jgi:hypothetical protein
MTVKSFVLRLVLSLAIGHAAVARGDAAVALYYGHSIPIEEFRAFDIVVVDPEHGFDPNRFRSTHRELYAYAALGEVQAHRPYFKDIPGDWKLAKNADWGSEVIDQTPPGWPDFFADRVIAPLWERGYRGFFLDALDAYRLAKSFDENAQQAGLVRVIEALHRRFPGIRLILNRGFEIVPRVRDKIQMVAAESLFQGWNAARKRYEPVPAADRAWLLGQLRALRERYDIPILVIDYLPPHDRPSMRQTAQAIKALGFIPWVTDGHLDSLGMGSREVLPRRILVAYNGDETPALNFADVHRFLQMPLNHLGYIVDYHDIRQPLPEAVRADRYAGLIAWFTGTPAQPAGRTLAAWLARRVEEGLPLALFGDIGFLLEPPLSKKLGLRMGAPAGGELAFTRIDAMFGFETPPQPPRREFEPLLADGPDLTALLELEAAGNRRYIASAIAPWGGYVQHPFVLRPVPGTDAMRWVVDPFAFVKRALRLPDMPVPDTTTENGRRLLFSHIDGDGFPSIAELPGRPFAGEALLTQILEKYPVPTTVSVIEGEISPDGLHPKESPKLEDIARRIFRLPHVEIASHTYSHPFRWDLSVRHGIFQDEEKAYYHLELPGYRLDLRREIVGSVDYIRQRLAPPGKPVNILLWSGDTAPDAEALRIAYAAGLLNMNGGDTTITRSDRTLTAVGANGIVKDGLLQIYAPIANENIYTNLWRGPYYGYGRVIETFELTESPRRLKPVDIYYHSYSASKRAGIDAVHKALAWALAQPLHPIFASEYIRKVMDFYRASIAREGDAWIVRTDGELRTVRLPYALGAPDLATAEGVVGFADGPEARYLHLSGGEARFTSQADHVERRPFLHSANARIGPGDNRLGADRMSLSLQGHLPLQFGLANVQGCRISANDRPISPVRSERSAAVAVQHYRLSHAAAKIAVRCPAR